MGLRKENIFFWGGGRIPRFSLNPQEEEWGGGGGGVPRFGLNPEKGNGVCVCRLKMEGGGVYYLPKLLENYYVFIKYTLNVLITYISA